MDLATIFPQPCPVTLAGRRLLARPLRLRQLAELQGWLRAILPSPAEGLDARLDGLDDEARRRVLVGAYLDAESWPVAFGTAIGDAALGLAEGRAAFLAVALPEFNPELAPEDLGAMARDATDAEWAGLLSACYGLDPLDSIARRIDPAAFAGRARDEAPDWAPAIVDALERWSFDQVADLTPGQLAFFRSRGEAAAPDAPPRPGETRDQAAERRRAYFDLDGEGADDGE